MHRLTPHGKYGRMSLQTNKGKQIGNTLFLIPTACFAAGIWSAATLRCGIYFYIIPATLSLLIVAARMISDDVRRNPDLSGWLFNAFIGLFMFASGGMLYLLSLPSNHSPVSRNGYLFGEVETVSRKTYGDLIVIRLYTPVSERKNNGESPEIKPTDIRILATSSTIALEPGDIISFSSKLMPIADGKEDADSKFAMNMLNNNVLWKTRLSASQLKIIGELSTPHLAALKIRKRIEIFIENSGLSKGTASFLVAVLLGDRSFIDSATRKTFSDGGVSHVLALSGMHIGIIVMLLTTVFFPLNFTGKRNLRYILTLIALWGYAFITGLSPTIVRASLMTTFAFTARFLQRKGSAFNALCFATLLILISSPGTLFNLGLQLSFLCVASIILFVRQLNRVDRGEHPLLYNINSMVLTSLVATLSTWIVTAHNFGTFPIMFLPANLIVLPLLPFYLSLAIIYLGLRLAGYESFLLGEVLDKGYDTLTGFLNLLSQNGSLTIGINPGIESVVLWLAGMMLIAIVLNSDRSGRWIIAGSSLLLISLILL